jgi:hypothetical protein
MSYITGGQCPASAAEAQAVSYPGTLQIRPDAYQGGSITSTPNINIAAVDPWQNLLNENGRLMRENIELRQKSEELHKRTNSLAVPDWALDPLNYGFSNMGRLLVRIQHWLKHNPLMGSGDPHALMKMGKLDIYNAVECMRDSRQEMAIFTRVGNEALVVYDSLELYPSDSLLTKLLTLADSK